MRAEIDAKQPLFAVDGARKDIRHARNIAEAAGVRLKALEVADSHLEHVQQSKGAKGDLAGIYGACREESGLTYGNGK
jgi:3-hydroxyisobutyrate dehydrogenase-like beta-hydroxyacid dehydrogenase